MSPGTGRLPLSFLVPTYNREELLERTLRKLAADPGVLSYRVPVLVSDNASPDGTADLVRRLQAELPDFDLRLQVQPENLGAGSLKWLVEHAPDTDYVWTLADDDWPAEGAVEEVVATLAAHPVDVLHLPHCWVNADGSLQARSPAPGRLELFPSSRELFLQYTHWLSFISATVVRREALQRAAAEAPTTNNWQPHLWFTVAGRLGPCAVAPRMLVVGDGSGVSWSDKAVQILTRDVIEAYDEGFHLVVDEHEFGTTLDGRYADQRFIELWARADLDLLAGAVRRFPTSAELRTMLWRLAQDAGRRDLYAVADEAAVAAGAAERADAHVREGEERFARGDVRGAVEAFNAALAERPTSADAWNDLGVALGWLGLDEAATAVQTALELDPEHADALANRAGLVPSAA
jgi:glycosyltransferase involved in cell wall biosynthesis